MKNLTKILKKQDALYDCILMLSGGKDSVLALYDILSSKDLSILAISYDDGYLSKIAKENIVVVSKYFGIDNLTLRYDMRDCIDSFVDSDLVKTVDLNTFIEIFQNIFWEKIKNISDLFGKIPVVTGNIGYFSSEEYLPDQCKSATDFIQDFGISIPKIDCTFISYWAEEPYCQDFEILKEFGWQSESELNTEDGYIRNLRHELNLSYPKRTLDKIVEEHWVELTRSRFC